MRLSPALLDAFAPGLAPEAVAAKASSLLKEREELDALGVDQDPLSERWLRGYFAAFYDEGPEEWEWREC